MTSRSLSEAFDGPPPSSSSSSSSSEKLEKTKSRKPRFVPWEPFKGATSEEPPSTTTPSVQPSGLIPYRLPGEEEPNNNDLLLSSKQTSLLVDGRRNRVAETEKEDGPRSILEEELAVEREVNAELKRLLMAAMSEDLQTHVVALSEDKIRLARAVDRYARKMSTEDEHCETLEIEKDVWKCKFLAMSVRADELQGRVERLLSLLRSSQRLLCDLLHTTGLGQDTVPSGSPPRALLTQARRFADMDVQSLYTRSPCEQRVRPPEPKFSNLTIACCKNCAGREIQLL